MKIMGCDFHPSLQQIAMVDSETGEHWERKLTPDEARQFNAELRGPVPIGMEACGSNDACARFLVGLHG
jgi:transposase